jgi:spore germination protein
VHPRLSRTLATALTLGVLGAGLATAGPVAAQNAPAGAKGRATVRPIVTGWMPYWMPSTSTSAVTSHASLFDEASPFLIQTTSATGLSYQGSASTMSAMVQSLHAVGVKVVPTLTTSMDAERFAALLSSRRQRSQHVRAIVGMAERFGVDGVDLDYESINFGSSTAKDVVRARYPLLLAQLDTALAAAGMVSSVTVPSRRSDSDPNWWVFDYPALGAAVDRFKVMTYDYSWSGGDPGPMAPKSWVDEVIGYAASRVTAGKISIGLPAYGRDWFVRKVSGRCPAAAHESISRTSQGMRDFAASRGVRPVWNAAQTSSTFTYRQHYSSAGRSCTVKRVAWFDDARSVAAKLPLVAKHGVRGVAIWALGNETPGMWDRLHTFAANHPVLPTTLRVDVPATVTYGRTARVSGVVRVDGHAASGARVSLWRRALGGRWTQVGHAVSGTRGGVQFAVSPHRHSSYRLTTAATWHHRAARSVAKTSRVSYAVSVARTKARVSATARTFDLSGVVAPALSGTRVELQRLLHGRWLARGATPVDRAGRFDFSVSTRKAGVRTLRVVALPGQLDAGRSARVRLTIP